jgi:hypothetical protein
VVERRGRRHGGRRCASLKARPSMPMPPRRVGVGRATPVLPELFRPLIPLRPFCYNRSEVLESWSAPSPVVAEIGTKGRLHVISSSPNDATLGVYLRRQTLGVWEVA